MKTTRVFFPCTSCAGAGFKVLPCEASVSMPAGPATLWPKLACDLCSGSGKGALKEINESDDGEQFAPEIAWRRIS